jgi:hypothetical protein
VEAEKASFAGKPQKLNDGSGENYGAAFEKVQKIPVGHTQQKVNDVSENNYGAVFHTVTKHPVGQTPQKLNEVSGNNYGAVFHKVTRNPVGQTPQELNDVNGNNYSAVFQRVQKAPVERIQQEALRSVRKLEREVEGLYNSCDCRRRNGLQNDCRQTYCHGRPECLTDPPTCLPSRGIWYE